MGSAGNRPAIRGDLRKVQVVPGYVRGSSTAWPVNLFVCLVAKSSLCA
jgi:hypothetical protein